MYNPGMDNPYNPYNQNMRGMPNMPGMSSGMSHKSIMHLTNGATKPVRFLILTRKAMACLRFIWSQPENAIPGHPIQVTDEDMEYYTRLFNDGMFLPPYKNTHPKNNGEKICDLASIFGNLGKSIGEPLQMVTIKSQLMKMGYSYEEMDMAWLELHGYVAMVR